MMEKSMEKKVARTLTRASPRSFLTSSSIAQAFFLARKHSAASELTTAGLSERFSREMQRSRAPTTIAAHAKRTTVSIMAAAVRTSPKSWPSAAVGAWTAAASISPADDRAAT